MIKFDSNNVISGYIKELLKSFNLPSCKIKSMSDQDHIPDTSYIDGNSLYYVDKTGAKETVEPYYFNAKLPLNLEKHLVVKELRYDSYTHRYLGEYLRYLRDYKNIDLMSLYNCFDNNLINIKYNNKFIDFDSEDGQSKIYAIPVKLDKKYTIAIDCQESIEMFCGFFDNTFYNNIDKADRLSEATYLSKAGCLFNKPFVYDKLLNFVWSEEENKDIAEHEQDLRLIIKIPLNNTSSIAVLEGDYTLCAEKVTIGTPERPSMRSPKLIHNYDESVLKDIDSSLVKEMKLSTKSQLLQYNTHVSYPFADKLFGYLLDNTVTPLDDISDNFKRIKQQLLNTRNRKGSQQLYNYIRLNCQDYQWYYIYNLILSDLVADKNEKNYSNANDTLDVLGYFDKDAENLFDDIDIYGDMNWKESDR